MTNVRTFSLRTFCIVIAAVSILSTWAMRRAIQQQAAVAALDEMEWVQVYYDYELLPENANASESVRKPISVWCDMRHSVELVEIWDPAHMLDAIPHLRRLPRLKKVRLPVSMYDHYQREAKFLERELPQVEILYDIPIPS